jgi:hypothetical protein
MINFGTVNLEGRLYIIDYGRNIATRGLIN